MTTESPETRDEIEEAAATWIAQRDGEAWSQADAASLDAWLAESAGHRVAYYRLNAVWIESGRIAAASKSSRYRLLAVAATVLILIAGTLVSLQNGLFRSKPDAPPPVAQTSKAPATDAAVAAASPPPEDVSAAAPQSPFQQRYSTAVGASRAVSLPDGSRVTLDTDSQIRVSIDGRSRIVRLDRGQAFFEVAHDTRRPFVVDAGRLRVVAVGTEFSVRRVASDIRVVVAEGTVRLEGNSLLPAGGIARVEGERVQIHQAQPTEVARNLSWRSGVLTFRHTPLSEAAAEFNRYDARRIVILDPAIAALELGGVFRSDDVEAFAQLLERTFHIDAVVHPDRIELTARRSP